MRYYAYRHNLGNGNFEIAGIWRRKDGEMPQHWQKDGTWKDDPFATCVSGTGGCSPICISDEAEAMGWIAEQEKKGQAGD